MQRFSRHFLDAAHRLSAAPAGRGVTAWSEMATPSLCHHLELRLGHLRAAHLGEPFSFAGRVTRDEWERLCDGGGRKGALFHALKWEY